MNKTEINNVMKIIERKDKEIDRKKKEKIEW